MSSHRLERLSEASQAQLLRLCYIPAKRVLGVVGVPVRMVWEGPPLCRGSGGGLCWTQLEVPQDMRALWDG